MTHDTENQLKVSKITIEFLINRLQKYELDLWNALKLADKDAGKYPNLQAVEKTVQRRKTAWHTIITLMDELGVNTISEGRLI